MRRKLKDNKLLMYLIQNRADDFIKEFEKQAPSKTLPRRYPVKSLYLYVYAAKILLDANDWRKDLRKTVSVTRESNLRIWEYLLRKGLVPDDYHERLIEAGLQWTWADETYDYEDVFGAPLDDLLQWGARRIDCDLFVAVQKLDFKETEVLLKQGANPGVEICVEDPANHEYPETVSSFFHASVLWQDAYACQFLDVIWEHGIKKIDTEIDSADFMQLIQSSTHKLMYELLEK
jgi:hypothetical protein